MKAVGCGVRDCALGKGSKRKVKNIVVCSENCWGHTDATQVSGQQQQPRIYSRSTKGKPPERYEPGPPSKPSMHKVSSKLPDAFLTLTLA